jgi:hypothetical protein
MTFVCEYCGHGFKRESTIANHMCIQKKRVLQKESQPVRLGFKFFNDWYRIAMGVKTPKTYEAFTQSRYYASFVRFGIYVLETRVIAPERYLEWLIKGQVPVDRWCKDSVYNNYLAEQSKCESADRALERFVLHAERWAETPGRHWSEYWHSVSVYTLLNDIKMGKISPWIFLGYSKAKEKLDSLPLEMLNEIANTIDLPFWQKKISQNQSTVLWIEQILGSV